MISAPLRRNRDFMLLQAGQLLSNVGTQVTQIAFPLLVLALTHSAAKAGIVAFVRALPLALFALPGGLAADRLNRKWLMIICDAVGALAMAGLGLAIAFGRASFWQVAVVAFVEGASSATFWGASMGATRSVVPPSQLPMATSVLTARRAIVRLAGAPLGGVLFGLARSLPFFADAGSYALSSASLAAMRTPFQEKRERETAPMAYSLLEGVRFLWSSAFLRTIVVLFSLAQVIQLGVTLALVVIGKRQGLSSGAIGGLVAAFGLSLLVGSVLAPFTRRLLPTRVLIVLELWTWAGSAFFLVWPSVYVLAASLFPTGLAIPTTDSVVWPYQLSLTPDRLIGRTQSAISSIILAMGTVGPLAVGFLLTTVSERATIGVMAAFGLTLAVWGTLSPAIRDAPSIDLVA